MAHRIPLIFRGDRVAQLQSSGDELTAPEPEPQIRLSELDALLEGVMSGEIEVNSRLLARLQLMRDKLDNVIIQMRRELLSRNK